MANSLLFICGIFLMTLAGKIYQAQGTSERIFFTKLRGAVNPVMAVLDKPITIDCSVNNKNIKISLLKLTSEGKKIKMNVDGKNVKKIGNVFTIKITSYKESSKYFCHGELYGNIYEVSVDIIVIATTQELTPRPEIFPSVAKANIGESVQLSCLTNGIFSVIKWTKNGRKVLADGKNIFINETYVQRARGVMSKFFIKHARTTDAGQYRCTVTTKLDDSYVSYIEAKVAVKSKALYWSSNMDQNLVAVGTNAAAVIDCKVSLLSVKVTFFLENEDGSLFKIPTTSGRYQLLSQQQLIIRSASINDMGVYVCKADGLANKKVHLFVNPATKNVCDLYRPHGLRRICKTNRQHFTQFMSGLLRQMSDD